MLIHVTRTIERDFDIRTMDDVRRANKDMGYYWFDSDTMKWHGTRILSCFFEKTQTFIASHWSGWEHKGRVYTVHKFNSETCDIENLATFPTKYKAEKYQKELLNGVTPKGENK